jgi:AcrR family transcriptional regulator
VRSSVVRREQAIDAAERILEAEGPDAVTMRRLGAELGMRAPSLYKHVRDKAEIEAALQERALRALGATLDAAAPGLDSLAAAYRGWALAHPRLYALSARQVLHRDRLTPGVEQAAAAPLLAAVGGDEHRARALWAFAHGLVDLELADRFPPGADIDAAWAAGLRAFQN